MIRNLMKNLLGMAAREDATTDELGPSLQAAEAELIAARDGAATAETVYRGALLTADEAKLQQLDAARREAAVRIDRCEALVAALSDRLATAREREAEVARIERYEAARRQADDAAAALREMYPQLAEGLTQLLEGVARAEIEIRAVNADLPRGAICITAVERRVRDIAETGAWARQIAETLNIPGFRAGDPEYFRPIPRPLEGNITPSDVLQNILQLRAKPRYSDRPTPR